MTGQIRTVHAHSRTHAEAANPPAPTRPARQELEVSDCPDLLRIEGLPAATRLTSLALNACPSAVRAASQPSAALAALPQLRALALTGSGTLHRLPSGASALTALTALEVDLKMRDRGPEGPEPEDFAPLGRGGDGDAGLLRAWGLRRLAVRGFGGPLHLPEGMDRFSDLQVRPFEASTRPRSPRFRPPQRAAGRVCLFARSWAAGLAARRQVFTAGT